MIGRQAVGPSCAWGRSAASSLVVWGGVPPLKQFSSLRVPFAGRAPSLLWRTDNTY